MTEPVALVTRPTAAAEFRQQAVELLRKRLAEAEAGEIEAVIIITKYVNECWSEDHTGVQHFPEMIGRLEITKQAWTVQYLKDSK